MTNETLSELEAAKEKGTISSIFSYRTPTKNNESPNSAPIAIFLMGAGFLPSLVFNFAARTNRISPELIYLNVPIILGAVFCFVLTKIGAVKRHRNAYRLIYSLVLFQLSWGLAILFVDFLQ